MLCSELPHAFQPGAARLSDLVQMSAKRKLKSNGSFPNYHYPARAKAAHASINSRRAGSNLLRL
jgi:hypothetical protein